MKIIEAMMDISKIARSCVLTIGNFDSVHLGHQAILTAAKQTAAEKATELVVMTFEPHPLAILRPEKAPGTLTPLVLKKHLLAELGVDWLFIVKSTKELLSHSAEDFVRQFLIEQIQPSIVVEGKDFNFGVNRAGSVKTLQKFAYNNGFDVIVVEPKEVRLSSGQTVRVSSTAIRNMLKESRVADAAILLGRAYRVIGDIIPGRGKGKKLGFPTLNMKKPQQIIPAEGVYAGTVEISSSEKEICAANEKIPAVFSIGRASTYGQSQSLLIEAHLLADNAERFSGQYMAMDFIERIRDQQKFKTEKELSAQIAKDCQHAKKILATGRLKM